MKLLVVESPTKAKTISKFLNNDWQVVYSQGHIVDLPKTRHGIKVVDNKYKAEWVIIDEYKKKILKRIRDLTSKAESVYLGLDDDREGEKIANDIIEHCNLKRYYRIIFHEITKEAVLSAIENAKYVNENMVKAQIARRLIDREVGYKLSNIIKWHFKKNGKELDNKIGVGRVVSPALAILVKREKEIRQFVTEKIYKVYVDYIKDGVQFRVKHPTIFKEDTKEEMNSLISYLNRKDLTHIVEIYKQITKEQSPYPPLITSRLQRGSFYLFGFEPSYTMQLAQKLFEVGLITYHRTDSYHISEKAVLEIIRYLNSKYDNEKVLQVKRNFTNKKNAHQAHEAIRPIYFTDEFAPENIKKNKIYTDNQLTDEHLKVYNYIWNLTLATQMVDSIYDKSEVKIRVGENILTAKANSYAMSYDPSTGTYKEQKGWEELFGSYLKTAERDSEDDWKDNLVCIPNLVIGEQLKPINIDVVDGQSKKPPRYGVGRFITYLENKGIGRPSTFASIYQKLVNTKCVKIINNQMLCPQEIGIEITDWLEENASWVIDLDRASEFEKVLDLIEQGEVYNIDEFIKEYSDMIEKLKEDLGYTEEEQLKPSDKQIEYYRKIVKAKNLEIDSEILNNKEKIQEFLNASKIDRIKIGKCPICENLVFGYNFSVEDKNSYYKCSNKSCSFYLNDKTVKNFFLKFKKEFNVDERIDAVKKILSRKKGYQFDDLISNKTNKPFSAKLYVCKQPNSKYWNIQMSFKGLRK